MAQVYSFYNHEALHNDRDVHTYNIVGTLSDNHVIVLLDGKANKATVTPGLQFFNTFEECVNAERTSLTSAYGKAVKRTEAIKQAGIAFEIKYPEVLKGKAAKKPGTGK